MGLLQINLSNKFKSQVMKSLLDLSNGMYKLEPQMYNFYLNKLLLLTTPFYFNKSMAYSHGFKSINIIGPHNREVLSIIFGSLLGNAQAKKFLLGRRSSTKIIFFQEGIHVEYIFFLHKMFSYLNYCDSKIPVIITKLGSKGKIFKTVEFSTWSYTSFNWIYDLWWGVYPCYVGENPTLKIKKYWITLIIKIWLVYSLVIMSNSVKTGFVWLTSPASIILYFRFIFYCVIL